MLLKQQLQQLANEQLAWRLGSSIDLHFLFWIPRIWSHTWQQKCVRFFSRIQRNKLLTKNAYERNKSESGNFSFFFISCNFFLLFLLFHHPKSFMHFAYTMRDFVCHHQLRLVFVMWKSCANARNNFIHDWNGLIDWLGSELGFFWILFFSQNLHDFFIIFNWLHVHYAFIWCGGIFDRFGSQIVNFRNHQLILNKTWPFLPLTWFCVCVCRFSFANIIHAEPFGLFSCWGREWNSSVIIVQLLFLSELK